MRLIVPFLPGKLHELVIPVLRVQGLQPHLIPLDETNGYCQLMRQIWRRLETTAIVEQDILPWPGAVKELLDCPCEWGTYSYYTNGGIGIAHMLGCAKITATLISKLPDLWDAEIPWQNVDSHLFFAARDIGIEPHLHRPPVIHLNPRELGL